MKYIFFSSDGTGLPIAYQLQVEANDVYVGMVTDLKDIGSDKEDPEHNKRRLSLFDGMFNIKMDSRDLLKKMSTIPMKDRSQYFVVCDFNDLWPIADEVRKLGGFRGLLPHKADRDLEEDRMMAKEFVKKRYSNVDIQDVYEFKKVDDAVDFMAEESETPFVLKGFHEECPTVVPEANDPEINHKEILDVLKKNADVYEKEGFILEEKITDVLEFTPEAISFDGKVLGVNVDIEAKGLGAGDSGRQSGCSLDLIFWLDLKSKVYEMFLKPAEDFFLRKDEMTVWDASILYSPSRNKFYFGEYCGNRFGYNAIFTELATFRMVSDYFEKLVKKEELYSGTVKQFGASLRAFNLVDDKENPGMKIKDSIVAGDKNDKNVWLMDIKESDNSLYNAGLDKDLMVLTGAGDTINEAVKTAYETEKTVSWTGKYIRPQHDFLSVVYPSSILNRFNNLKNLLFKDLPDVKWVYDLVEYIPEKPEKEGFLGIGEKKGEEKVSFIKALKNKKEYAAQ